MKKLTKVFTACSIGTLVFMATGCGLLFQAVKKIAEYEPGSTEYIDDNSIMKITEPGLYKIENFHVDVSKVAEAFPNSKLYTYQINRNDIAISAKNLGYIKNISKTSSYDYSGNSDEHPVISFHPERTVVEQENLELLGFNCNGGTNLIPEFAAEVYRNPGKLLDEAAKASRAVEDGNFQTRDLYRTETFYVASGVNADLAGKTSDAIFMYEGEHCLVYQAEKPFPKTITFEKDGQKVTIDQNKRFSLSEVKTIADRFDNLYSKVTGIMGKTDTSKTKYTAGALQDDYDKIVIFIDDIVQDHQVNFGIVGYFYGGDLLDGQYSNKCRMINVDSYFLKYDFEMGTKTVESTLAHEFTHMCNFINKVILTSKNNNNITWLTEMLAMTCEDILSSEIEPINNKNKSSIYDSRLPYFNYAYSLGFNNWNNNYSDAGRTSATYANTYAMGAFFLRNFAPNGERIEFINHIATNKFGGFDAIGYSLSDKGYITGGKNNAENFQKAYSMFPQVLINAGKSNKATLYVQGDEEYDRNNYFIKLINLNDYELKINETSTQKGPFILDKTQMVDLGSYGFDVHAYGEIKDFDVIDIEREKNKNVDFYIYIQ